MAANTAPIFVAVINNHGTAWTNADSAATSKDIFTAASNGSRLAAVAATNNYGTAHDFGIYLHDGTTAFLAGMVTVPINAGNVGSTASVNMLSLASNPWLNSDGSLTLPTGWKAQAKNVTQVGAGGTVSLVALGGDY